MTTVAPVRSEELLIRGGEALYLARWIAAPPDEALLHEETDCGLLRALGADPGSLPSLGELQVEHAALFAAPGPRHVPACESVYRDRFAVEFSGCGMAAPAGAIPVEGLLWGPTTPSVLTTYRVAGWDLPERCALPPDHFAVELEFYGRLLVRAVEDASALETARRFLVEHLAAWASKFLRTLIGRPCLRYYGHVASAALAWIESEVAQAS